MPCSRPPPEQPQRTDGLQLKGWAVGALHQWLRSSDGQWLGLVTFVVPMTDGKNFRAVEQLVPAEALRLRK